MGAMDTRAERLRSFLNKVHGKHIKVILDSEPEYYFEGRAEMKNFERTRALGQIEPEIACNPYKWELVASDENRLWDSFHFESASSGIIKTPR